MTKLTSRIFDAWDALYDYLDNLDWPANPTTFEAVTANGDHAVWYGDMPEPRKEAVIVAGIVAAPSTSTNATMGSSNSMTNTFSLRVNVGTRGPDIRTVRARIAELLEVIQVGLRSSVSGRPAGDFNTTVPGVQWWRVLDFTTEIGPLDDGYSAWAEVDVEFHCYI